LGRYNLIAGIVAGLSALHLVYMLRTDSVFRWPLRTLRRADDPVAFWGNMVGSTIFVIVLSYALLFGHVR
jgi:hypothetical protein